jgi:hypothetical protein
MKLIVVLLGIAAGGAATIAAGTALGHASAPPAPTASAPQHVRLVVLDDGDRMLGPNLVVRPGRVVLTIVNRAHHAHLFAVPDLGVTHVVLPLSTTTVRFSVRDGVFHWFCKFPPCAETMNGDIYVSDHPPAPHGAPWATAA